MYTLCTQINSLNEAVHVSTQSSGLVEIRRKITYVPCLIWSLQRFYAIYLHCLHVQYIKRLRRFCLLNSGDTESDTTDKNEGKSFSRKNVDLQI